MKVIDNINKSNDTQFSYEIIPPLRGKGIKIVLDMVESLKKFNPPFIDVTSHASTVSLNKVGKAGEIVTVKDGFAKNFLIPEKKAIIANKKNKADLENRITQINSNNDKKIVEANEIKEKLDQKKISIAMEANDDGSLYGAVSQKSVSESIYSLLEIKISPDAVVLDPITVSYTHLTLPTSDLV